MMKPVARTRFVAGAICTHCRVADRMVIDLDMEGVTLARRCLGCGAAESMPAMDVAEKAEPADRIPSTIVRIREID